MLCRDWSLGLLTWTLNLRSLCCGWQPPAPSRAPARVAIAVVELCFWFLILGSWLFDGLAVTTVYNTRTVRGLLRCRAPTPFVLFVFTWRTICLLLSLIFIFHWHSLSATRRPLCKYIPILVHAAQIGLAWWSALPLCKFLHCVFIWNFCECIRKTQTTNLSFRLSSFWAFDLA